MSFFRRLTTLYPLTLFGSLLFLAALLLLGSGLARGEALATGGGLLAMGLCIIAATVPRFIPTDGLLEDVSWDSAADLTAGFRASGHRLSMRRWRLPPFYRFHAAIRYELRCGDRLTYSAQGLYRLEGVESCDTDFRPPLPGTLYMHASFSIQDVFGLGRRRLGQMRDRQCTVLASRHPLGDIKFIDSRTSEDDNAKAKKSDQEKIFIRDYQPGDLARDINWKASGRINKLLTRIPPESEARTRLVRMLVLSESGGNSARGGYHLQLAAIKSLVSGLIDGIRSSHPGYRIELYLNKRMISISDTEDERRAYRALADWLPPERMDDDALPRIDSSVMVFSHSLCANLFKWIRGYRSEDLDMYLVQGVGEEDRPGSERRSADLAGKYLPAEITPGAFFPRVLPGELNPPALRFDGSHCNQLRQYRLRCLW